MTPKRTRMTGEQRREQLLDVCAAIVDTEGFHAVSIERVATESGITRTVIYQQFGSLGGMLDAMIERAGNRAGKAFVEATSAGDHPSFRNAMARVIAAVDADPATWRLFLATPDIGPPSLAARLDRGRALIRDYSMKSIRCRPGKATDDPELTARMLQAIADELVRLRLADPAVYTIERILTQVDLFAQAILGPRHSSPAAPAMQ